MSGADSCNADSISTVLAKTHAKHCKRTGHMLFQSTARWVHKKVFVINICGVFGTC